MCYRAAAADRAGTDWRRSGVGGSVSGRHKLCCMVCIGVSIAFAPGETSQTGLHLCLGDVPITWGLLSREEHPNNNGIGQASPLRV